MKTDEELNKIAEGIICNQIESDSDGFESFWRYQEVEKAIKLAYKKVESEMYSRDEVIALLNDFNITINRTSGGLAFGETAMFRWINQNLKIKP